VATRLLRRMGDMRGLGALVSRPPPGRRCRFCRAPTAQFRAHCVAAARTPRLRAAVGCWRL